ncbi:hypothetical protein Dfri01_46500 [Dyadobacter frigoris]|uniref:hypothetical protein n=1 Tax=Dyadobacter frigoris TaxID=2576211 RepID=UPI0024A109D2|nr:hypothetical protein [Dyadobacter frigoris]GLU55189.1 hypothetical protein Dfri01_46500 [Dyadobacter frigoris]
MESAKTVSFQVWQKGDYEDIAILNGQIFVLKCNGFLYTFPISDAIYEEADKVEELKTILPKGEYEGMYADEFKNQLYILCKKCEADYSWNTTTGYIVQPGDSIYVSSSFQINVSDIKQYDGKVKEGFRPSALAKNPISGEWFVPYSANKLLVITDSSWKAKQAYPLTGNIFNQPEGIAFDKTGNLYISNEGNHISSGDILKFQRGSIN